MSNAYDAIIVGTGQAGAPLAGRLSEAGMKVAIVERKLFGGTCVNTGCTPTKTLVASAYAAHLARRAADFGVVINGQVGVDMKKVKARKDAVSGQSQKNVESWLKQLQNCTVYQGHARFTSPTEMSVGTTLLTAPFHCSTTFSPSLISRRSSRSQASKMFRQPWRSKEKCDLPEIVRAMS